MPLLANALPEDEIRSHINRQLIPGRVLYLLCTFIVPPKNKFVVLLAVEKKTLLFFINSKITRYISQDEHLRSMQVPLEATEYEFLDHDSWLNCSEVIKMDLDEIEKQLMKDSTRIKGELTPGTRQQILKIIPGAQTISPSHKSRILTSL